MNLQRIRKWYKKLTCKHIRRAKFYPENVSWQNTNSGANGKHQTIIVEGCLNCHRLWIRDFGE